MIASVYNFETRTIIYEEIDPFFIIYLGMWNHFKQFVTLIQNCPNFSGRRTKVRSTGIIGRPQTNKSNYEQIPLMFPFTCLFFCHLRSPQRFQLRGNLDKSIIYDSPILFQFPKCFTHVEGCSLVPVSKTNFLTKCDTVTLPHLLLLQDI